MGKKAGLQSASVAMLLFVATPTYAQSSGWAKFGEMLGGREQRSQEIYEEEIARRYQLDGARARAYSLQADATMRERLFNLWQSAGVPADEARSVVSSYQFNPSWEAVVASVRRSGSQQGINDMWEAYRNRNFVLANDILLSVVFVLKEEEKAKSVISDEEAEKAKGRAELDALGIRLEATDPDYERKLNFLEPELKEIIALYPPSEWVTRVERAFAETRL